MWFVGDDFAENSIGLLCSSYDWSFHHHRKTKSHPGPWPFLHFHCISLAMVSFSFSSLPLHFSVFSHYTSYSMQDWRICSFRYIHNYNLCTLCSKLELLSARGWPTAPSLHSRTSFVPNSKAPLCHFILFWIKTWVHFQVVCGVRGHLGPACNAVGHVDRQVWGINHLYSYPVWIRHKVL